MASVKLTHERIESITLASIRAGTARTAIKHNLKELAAFEGLARAALPKNLKKLLTGISNSSQQAAAFSQMPEHYKEKASYHNVIRTDVCPTVRTNGRVEVMTGDSPTDKNLNIGDVNEALGKEWALLSKDRIRHRLTDLNGLQKKVLLADSLSWISSQVILAKITDDTQKADYDAVCPRDKVTLLRSWLKDYYNSLSTSARFSTCSNLRNLSGEYNVRGLCENQIQNIIAPFKMAEIGFKINASFKTPLGFPYGLEEALTLEEMVAQAINLIPLEGWEHALEASGNPLQAGDFKAPQELANIAFEYGRLFDIQSAARAAQEELASNADTLVGAMFELGTLKRFLEAVPAAASIVPDPIIQLMHKPVTKRTAQQRQSEKLSTLGDTEEERLQNLKKLNTGIFTDVITSN